MLLVALLPHKTVGQSCRQASPEIQFLRGASQCIREHSIANIRPGNDNCGEQRLLPGSTPRGLPVARTPREETKANDRWLEFTTLLVSVLSLSRESCPGSIRLMLGVPRTVARTAPIDYGLRGEIGVFNLDTKL